MILERVSITGFRSVESIADLRIGSPTVLAGHNDAGKSAVLDAIRFLLGAYRLSMEDATLLQTDTNQSLEEPIRVAEVCVTGRFSLSQPEQDDLGLEAQIGIRRSSLSGLEYEVLSPTNADLRGYASETVALLTARIARLGLKPSGVRKNDLLATLDEAAALSTKEPIWAALPTAVERRMPRVESFGASSITDPEKAIRDSLQVAYQTLLASQKFAGRIGKIERRLESKLLGDAEALRAHVETRCGDLGELSIRPSVSLRGNLAGANVSVTNASGDRVGLSTSGMGRGRRIAFAVWEHTTARLSASEQDLVLLYDEPDTHLDYQRQREFMSLILEQAAQQHVRIVIASHSMNLIDGVDISDVVHLNHGLDHRSFAVQLVDDSDVGSHLGSIAASLGLRNTVLLHERLFVGVEGATEAQALPVLFKKARGRQLESLGIAIWPCDNHEGALKFARFLHERGRSVAFLVDADAREGSSAFSAANLQKAGLDPATQCFYVGDPKEMEDTFSDAVWARVACEIWPKVDGEDWTSTEFTALRAEKKFSQAVLDMLRENSEEAPSGKPAMLTRLALELRPHEVPQILLDRFEDLVRLAN